LRSNGLHGRLHPAAGLIQATDGNFYGTTAYGGASSSCSLGCGTVFKITPAGTLTTLHNFDATGGANPFAALVQATDGNFYGTTAFGGESGNCSLGCGTVFKITAAGTLTTLHSFDNPDGAYPYGSLVQGTNGNFYGATSAGGAGTACLGVGCGTVFEITPAGKLTTLHRFDGSDGSEVIAGLVQATDGNFYGTTQFGGASTNCTGGCGTVFKTTSTGTLTTLHNFDFADGEYPSAPLLQATNGNFYGTTSGGGANGDGTVFCLSVGLAPFLKTLPTSGKVGTKVTILGNSLTGTTSVTFNGTKATFTVNATGTAITTTVPDGATTGKVKVTTPSRTLTSNVKFRVTPTISSFSPTSGPVGTSVVITGESFTGATSVTFGGVKATSFTVDSYNQITATVPTGAKTGKIGVATPGGTATSTGTFTVT
jgi:uncharacterized repeat protein (TIGR03803 family)